MEENKNTNLCFNCAAPKEKEESVFCAYCGQKHGTGKISLREIIGEVVSNILNLDSKTIRTAAALLLPGKLTQEYFRGKHKSYSHPVRLFFVAAIFFFAALAANIGESLGTKNDLGAIVNGFVERGITLALMDSIKREVSREYPEAKAQAAMDSLVAKFEKSYHSELNQGTIRFNDFGLERDSLFVGDQYVRPEEFKNSSAKDLVNKYYGDHSFIRKVFARQGIKAIRDGRSMVDFMMGKIPLMLLVMMPFIALFLKLLYFRHQYFFVEHLFFSFHLHAFIFFFGTILFLLSNILPESLIATFALSIFVYLFLALKKVYGQSFGKTLLKFLMLLGFYMMLAAFFLALFSMISFLLF